MQMWTALLFVLQVALSAQKKTDLCVVQKSDVCIVALERTFESLVSQLQETEESLDTSCRNTEKTAECFYEMADKCKDAKPFSRIKKSVKKYLNEFCKGPSDERKLYLENSKCLNRNNVVFGECIPKISADLVVKDYSKQWCSDGKAVEKCLPDKMKAKCNKDGKEVIEMVMKPWNIIMSEICGGHRFMASMVLVFAFILTLFTINC